MKFRFHVEASYIEFKVKIFCSRYIVTILSFFKIIYSIKKDSHDDDCQKTYKINFEQHLKYISSYSRKYEFTIFISKYIIYIMFIR